MIYHGTITSPCGERPDLCPECGGSGFTEVDEGVDPKHHDWWWECHECGYQCKSAEEARKGSHEAGRDRAAGGDR